MKCCSQWAAFLLGLSVFAAGCTSKQDVHYTVILSLDGGRWDYPRHFHMPFLDSLASVGVSARMEPSYPASTFPNHYTMATGLVPDHHGLVNNTYWNPETDYIYAIKDPVARFDPRYYKGEPIWITAQKQGLKTGNVYWVGSDVAIQDTYPTYYRNWDEQPHWNFDQRADEIFRLLSLPEAERPRLVMGYFDEPDHHGHLYGPLAPETRAMAEHMDSLVHSLFLRLKALPHGDKINFIVTADHGMADVSPERFIPWVDVIPAGWTERILGNIPTMIWVKEGYLEPLYDILSQVEHLRVWKHGEVPEYLCYGTSERIGDLIVCPDLGWQFYSRPYDGGAHGFDCKELDMMVFFRAVGPDFKEAYQAPFTEGEQSAFRNIDLYPLLCRLLHIEPAPVDGRLDRIEKILK